MTSRAIRVLIADDHTVVRKALTALLDLESDIEVVGEAADGRAAVEATARLSPDVVLMDLAMPGGDGIDAIRRITARDETARILVLTSFAGIDRVLPAIKAGARGYLVKDASPDELVQAIQRVFRDEVSLSPQIARDVLRELRAPAGTDDRSSADGGLTPREVDVLRLVARGLSNQSIATTLHVSEPTVRTHVSAILGKLHLASRTQAALYALRQGLAPIEDDNGSG